MNSPLVSLLRLVLCSFLFRVPIQRETMAATEIARQAVSRIKLSTSTVVFIYYYYDLIKKAMIYFRNATILHLSLQPTLNPHNIGWLYIANMW